MVSGFKNWQPADQALYVSRALRLVVMGLLEGISYGFRFSFDLDEKVMRVSFLDLIKNPVF